MMTLHPYDERAEREDIALRYTNVRQSIPQTLQRLQQSPTFLAVVKQLRRKGWKDWHILQAIFNGVIDWHMQQTGADRDPQRIKEEGRVVFQRLLQEGESSTDLRILPTHFTLEAMEVWLNTGVATFLQKKGVFFRPRDYSFEKLRELAQKRYHYLDLDVPHAPFC